MGRVAALAVLFVAGCSQALDWREVQIADTELVVRFPCHPARFERTVEVAGRPLRLGLTSCDANGVTYGLATAEVGDPAQVDAVLAALADAARGGIAAGEPAATGLSFPGVTPYRGNVRVRLVGRRTDGQAVDEAVDVFARGTRVYQATTIGSPLTAAADEPFHAGLRFRGLQ
jgi:hypothetical protein